MKAKTYRNRGSKKRQSGDIEGAIKDLNKAINLDPDDYLSYFNLGFCYQIKKNYKAAINSYNKAIELETFSTDTSIYNNLGCCFQELGELEEAKKKFTKAIWDSHQEDMDPLLYLNRAEVEESLGNIERAKEDRKRASDEIKKKKYMPYWQNGCENIKDKNFEAAINDFNKVIEIDPYHDSAYHQKAEALQQLRDYQGAIDVYSDCLKLIPNDAFALYRRGALKADLEHYSDAIDDFNKAICIAENDNMDSVGHETTASFYGARADTKHQLKDYQGAIEDFSKAIEILYEFWDCGEDDIEPEQSSRYYVGRAVAKFYLGDLNTSLKDAEKGIDIESSSRSHNILGLIKESLEDYKGAIGSFNEALSIDDSDAIELKPLIEKNLKIVREKRFQAATKEEIELQKKVKHYWEVSKLCKTDGLKIKFFDHYRDAFFIGDEKGERYESYQCMFFDLDDHKEMSDEVIDQFIEYSREDIFDGKEHSDSELVKRFKVYAVEHALKEPCDWL